MPVIFGDREVQAVVESVTSLEARLNKRSWFEARAAR